MIRKILLVTTLLLFMLVNTSYYLEEILGVWALPFDLFLFLIFAIVVLVLLKEIFILIKNRHLVRKQSILFIAITTLFISLIVYKPFGFINFDKLAGKNIFVASRESVANCMITLKLKENNKFVNRSVCFGVLKTTGKYDYRNDTVDFFDISYNKDFYSYGVILTDSGNNQVIRLYRHDDDSLYLELFVKVNELKEQYFKDNTTIMDK